MEPRKKLEVKKLISELKFHRARHTELITVYVPSGYDMNLVMTQLTQEIGTAENIKSKGTRKNVQGALEKMVRQLRVVGRTPPNGLAAFSGNVSGEEGKQDFIARVIEPPAPLNVRIYKCDQTFFLEPLMDFLEPQHIFGLVVIDRQEANIGFLKGSRIEQVFGKDSLVPGKTRKGGQSAARFARVRDEMAKTFFKTIATQARVSFSNEKKLRGILVGGPGPTKDEFVSAYLDIAIKEKVIAIKNIGYTGFQGLQELVDKSHDVLAAEEVANEKAAVNAFFNMLNKRPSHAAYGYDEVKRAIAMGAIKKLLISDMVDANVAEELANAVETTGSEWMMISVDSREGEQLHALSGIAAILRFPVS